MEPAAYRIGKGVFELIDETERRLPAPLGEMQYNSQQLPVPTDLEIAASKLVRAVKAIDPAKIRALDELKRTDHWDQDDFIWEALLVSMATMGNSRGAILVKDERYHKRVTWDRIVNLPLSRREEELVAALSAAKVRMARKKARWLAENSVRIEREGGPAAVKVLLMQCKGREEKIRYLDTFAGIGPKYARNVLMDVYHPDFRDSIAIDERIKKVSKALGVAFAGYEAAEKFYIGVAHCANLTGWELDRLLYSNTDLVLAILSTTSPQSTVVA